MPIPAATRSINRLPQAIRRQPKLRWQSSDASSPPAEPRPSEESIVELPDAKDLSELLGQPSEDVAVARTETLLPGLLWAASREELHDFKLVEAAESDIVAWFQQRLGGLHFEPAFAVRVMTHPLAAGQHGNHNGKLSSLGSHVMRAHLAAFVNLHRNLMPDDIEIESLWLDEVLSPDRLAQGPAEALGIPSVMRYRHTNNVTTPMPRPTHRAIALQAVTGAVYKQHGIVTSMRFFNSRILPHLAYPRECEASVTEAMKSDENLRKHGSYLIDAVGQRQKRILREEPRGGQDATA